MDYLYLILRIQLKHENKLLNFPKYLLPTIMMYKPVGEVLPDVLHYYIYHDMLQ